MRTPPPTVQLARREEALRENNQVLHSSRHPPAPQPWPCPKGCKTHRQTSPFPTTCATPFLRTSIETIPTIDGPKWKATHTVSIPTSREEALQADAQGGSALKVYSDDSAIEGQLGAVVLFEEGRALTIARKRLGLVKEHIGMREVMQNYYRVSQTLLLGNQVVITSFRNEDTKPGQHLVKTLPWEINGIERRCGSQDMSETPVMKGVTKK